MDIREKFIKEQGCSYFNNTVLNEYSIWLEKKITDNYQALQLQQTGVSGCFSYQEALKFLELHTPLMVKPIKKSKYKFVDPFTSVNARNVVILSLATELSK